MQQNAFSPCGPMISAKEISEKYFNGLRTPRWVLRSVCPTKQIRFSPATIRWFEADVVEWLRNHRRPRAE